MTAASALQDNTPAPQHHAARVELSAEAAPEPGSHAAAEPDGLADVTICLTVTARMDRFDGPDAVATYLIELVRTAATMQECGFITAVTAAAQGTARAH